MAQNQPDLIGFPSSGWFILHLLPYPFAINVIGSKNYLYTGFRVFRGREMIWTGCKYVVHYIIAVNLNLDNSGLWEEKIS